MFKMIRGSSRQLLSCVTSTFFILAAVAGIAKADSFTDTLGGGINQTYWRLRTNTTSFTITTNTSGITFNKANGGTPSSFQYSTLCFMQVAQGNFDVRMDFTNATVGPVNGSPGNQIQLNTRFGAQDFLMVYSDEPSLGGINAHVFPNPPGTVGMGAINWPTNYGTLRVVRTGTLVQGYINSTLIYQNNYNTNDATFSFVLQNNGTADAVAVSFRNFSLTADHLATLPALLHGQLNSTTNLVLSWKDTSWPDYLRGYEVQYTTNLVPTNSWTIVASYPPLDSNKFRYTNSLSVGTGAGAGIPVFFRLHQGP